MVWLMAVVGLVILLLAGDALVKGAVNLSLRLGIPALIVSLTIVAFGTSAPELLISVSAVLEDAPGLALGNVVGSNTANVLLVLGVPALISTLKTCDCETRKMFSIMLVATLVFIGLAYTGEFGLWQGIVLLVGLALFLGDAARQGKRAHKDGQSCATPQDDDEDLEGADPDMPGWKIAMYLGLGLIGLPLGADILVESATVIARAYGVSETVIGLTLVAIGTSLPELATTVMAALRNQADVALGNVIGSNLFNLLAIIGVASMFGTIPVADQMLSFDLWVMLAASLVLIPFVFFKVNLNRIWGAILTSCYIGYVMAVLL